MKNNYYIQGSSVDYQRKDSKSSKNDSQVEGLRRTASKVDPDEYENKNFISLNNTTATLDLKQEDITKVEQKKTFHNPYGVEDYFDYYFDKDFALKNNESVIVDGKPIRLSTYKIFKMLEDKNLQHIKKDVSSISSTHSFTSTSPYCLPNYLQSNSFKYNLINSQNQFKAQQMNSFQNTLFNPISNGTPIGISNSSSINNSGILNTSTNGNMNLNMMMSNYQTSFNNNLNNLNLSNKMPQKGSFHYYNQFQQ